MPENDVRNFAVRSSSPVEHEPVFLLAFALISRDMIARLFIVSMLGAIPVVMHPRTYFLTETVNTNDSSHILTSQFLAVFEHVSSLLIGLSLEKGAPKVRLRPKSAPEAHL